MGTNHLSMTRRRAPAQRFEEGPPVEVRSQGRHSTRRGSGPAAPPPPSDHYEYALVAVPPVFRWRSRRKKPRSPSSAASPPLQLWRGGRRSSPSRSSTKSVPSAGGQNRHLQIKEMGKARLLRSPLAAAMAVQEQICLTKHRVDVPFPLASTAGRDRAPHTTTFRLDSRDTWFINRHGCSSFLPQLRPSEQEGAKENPRSSRIPPPRSEAPEPLSGKTPTTRTRTNNLKPSATPATLRNHLPPAIPARRARASPGRSHTTLKATGERRRVREESCPVYVLPR